MKLFIKDIPGLQLPKQANPGEDAAFDIVATTPPNIVGTKIIRPMDGMNLWQKITYIEYGTNLFYAPESTKDERGVLETYHTELFPRSSISKQNLVLANSVATIDAGYRNQVLVRFKYQWQPEDFVILNEGGGTRVYGVLNQDSIYSQGDKIVQLKLRKDIPVEIVLTNELPTSSRGLGGFGSSGK